MIGELLPDAYEPEVTPQVDELDELETSIGRKKTKYGSGADANGIAEIAAPKHLNHCGKSLKDGNATYFYSSLRLNAKQKTITSF